MHTWRFWFNPQSVHFLPPIKDFTIEQLDEELAPMSLICSLPAEYNNFVSSLLLLDSLSLSKLQSAFQNDETQRTTRGFSSTHSLALKASGSPSFAPDVRCSFCDAVGHSEASCFAKEKATKAAKAKTAERCQERSDRRKGGARRPQNAQEASETPGESANAVEYAGKASVALSASERVSWL
ncbi:hypothetical protein GLOTRDRAFT_130080 [Gloeophyllum trabeum ATCC 11539]|uniref:Uncharacterized protein n=1 Tax=Gloeophyllum trabeum (strain ATCC 11539 / FP-39264 / Madison 617) TaxID=670483 RepID=S7RPF8_GLOTA|nr:uncharacterized protein GLOTRDRAFT_130080 [Gloeophyllum trabeum ATCC 11539]EPQ54729.1 hypothetical protein GLOTRDRAFT_130080 [Gloeophyllum trabeum ATCC 11539]